MFFFASISKPSIDLFPFLPAAAPLGALAFPLPHVQHLGVILRIVCVVEVDPQKIRQVGDQCGRVRELEIVGVDKVELRRVKVAEPFLEAWWTRGKRQCTIPQLTDRQTNIDRKRTGI